MAQFAVNGYAVDAMDFMVKPVSYDNLKLKMSRALKRLDGRKDEKLVIQGKTGAQVVLIPQIRYVEVMNHKLTIYTTEGAVTASGSLSKIEEKFAGFDFSRCNNCYLVNLNYVTGVDDFTAYVGGDALSISRSRKKQFLKDIADHLGGSI
jgi:DNA-binding LytR/AlgR family response regulator